MKELTSEEFHDRIMAIQRAKAIFIESGLTENITTAFRAYQGLLADQERQIFLGIRQQGRRPFSFMDKYERPKCPACGADMMFRKVPENLEGIKVQLVCSKCDTVLNDRNDLDWWMNNLRKQENGSQGVPFGPETVQQDR